jgi:hypothetical protein
MPMPQTNPYYLWESFLRGCFDFLTNVVSICDTGEYDACSLVGDPTRVLPRKYFTLGLYAVSTGLHLCPADYHT